MNRVIVLTAIVAASFLLSFCDAARVTGVRSPQRWKYNGIEHIGVMGPVNNGYAPCDPSVQQMSGYFDIQADTHKHYFYWGFESRGNPLTDPVIIWLTGGPGCSSGLAVLVENGPCHIDSRGHLYNNVYSWNNAATVIYVDQPAGVGFSYGNVSGYDHNETQVAEDMFHFVQAFYAAFPQFLNNPLFVYGESYGGHFAPATAHRLWVGNQNHEGVPTPLTGLSVGNGLTEPQIQYKYYAELAYNWCLTVKGTPCISEAAYQQQVAQIPQCISMIVECQMNQSACAAADNFCGDTQMGPYENSGLNVYDIRIPCEVPGLCYNLSTSVQFFNRVDVQTALGVAKHNITWQTCNYQVNGMFSNDWMQNIGRFVPDLLSSNIRVLIYAGDMDFICNWLGNKAWTVALPWTNQTAFAAAPDQPWYVDMVEAGFARSVGNSEVNTLFSFVQVHGAGHMVPMDQPARILKVVQNFLADQPL